MSKLASRYFILDLTFTLTSNIIWVADTYADCTFHLLRWNLILAPSNYRIDLENEVVRHLANSDEIDMLVAADQVSSLHHVKLPADK